jgi:NAD(P) transhydrogenase subunit alpha
VTHAGRIVHEPTREAIEGPAEPAEPDSQPAPEPVIESAHEPRRDPDPATEQLDLPFDQEDDQ